MLALLFLKNKKAYNVQVCWIKILIINTVVFRFRRTRSAGRAVSLLNRFALCGVSPVPLILQERRVTAGAHVFTVTRRLKPCPRKASTVAEINRFLCLLFLKDLLHYAWLCINNKLTNQWYTISNSFLSERSLNTMKYMKSKMETLVKENHELKMRLKDMMKELDLEKNYALKALYHSEVTDNGPYQSAYQELDRQ